MLYRKSMMYKEMRKPLQGGPKFAHFFVRLNYTFRQFRRTNNVPILGHPVYTDRILELPGQVGSSGKSGGGVPSSIVI